jgi:uncharacterized phage protein gp47/JayE
MQFNTQKSILENMKQFLKSVSNTISDFTSGSVLSTLFYAISQGIGNLNESIRNVYNSIFISTATGEDLDLKVSDFSLVRKSATISTGVVTFSRQTPALQDYFIPSGTKVKTLATPTMAGIEFETTEDKLLAKIINEQKIFKNIDSIQVSLDTRFINEITTIVGVSSSGELNYTFQEGVDYELDKVSAPTIRHFLKWLSSGTKPFEDTIYTITYVPLSVEVNIQSKSVGSSNNLPIGAISDFVDIIAGIESVYNYDRTSGGSEKETDAQLRTRVPLYLSSLAKATKNAIRATALSVPGVVNVSVIEPTFPDGIIRVFVDDGSGAASETMLQDVRDAIDGSVGGVESTDAEAARAAGIGVNIESPLVLNIFIEMVIEYNMLLGISRDIINSDIKNTLINYLQSIPTGGTVYRSKIIDNIMDVSGVQDLDVSSLLINGEGMGNLTARVDQVPRTALTYITILEKTT